MKTKKSISLLLCVLCIIGFSGCKSNDSSNAKASIDEICNYVEEFSVAQIQYYECEDPSQREIIGNHISEITIKYEKCIKEFEKEYEKLSDEAKQEVDAYLVSASMELSYDMFDSFEKELS